MPELLRIAATGDPAAGTPPRVGASQAAADGMRSGAKEAGSMSQPSPADAATITAACTLAAEIAKLGGAAGPICHQVTIDGVGTVTINVTPALCVVDLVEPISNKPQRSIKGFDGLPDHMQAIIEAAPAPDKKPIPMTKLAALAGYGYYPWFRNAVDELVVDGWLVRSRKGFCRSDSAESACAGKRSDQ